MSISRVVRIVIACAAFGVLLTLVAVVISVIRAINGMENHISGDQLVGIFFTGAILGLPIVLWRLSQARHRESDDHIER